MEPTAAPAGAPQDEARSPPSTSSTQDHGKAQKGKGKLGSLENPEVYENVPGHVIPIIEREFDDFDTEAGKLPRAASSPRSSSSASGSSRASTASASPTCR